MLTLRELIALGVGGMVGGGIFSVLGLSVGLAGHAAPLAFALGGALALVTGWSYVKLGLCFHSGGGSFTYLEHAFRHPNIAGLGGWLLVAGYIGTLALYAYTFGAYGTALLGDGVDNLMLHHLLETAIILVFLGINLYGVRAAGNTEDVIVSWIALIAYLQMHDSSNLKWMLLAYLAIAAAEILFSKRRMFLKPAQCDE